MKITSLKASMGRDLYGTIEYEQRDALLAALEKAVATAQREGHPFRAWQDEATAAIGAAKGRCGMSTKQLYGWHWIRRLCGEVVHSGFSLGDRKPDLGEEMVGMVETVTEYVPLYADAPKPKRRRMKTIVHVNQHAIKANVKNCTRDPVLTVKTYKSNDYAHEVEIKGPCRIVYSPDKPLSCGARVWIETESEVVINPAD